MLKVEPPSIVCRVKKEKSAELRRDQTGIFVEPDIMASLTPEFCACNHHTPLTMQLTNLCFCYVIWGMNEHKQKIPANPGNTLRAKFPASVSADSVSRTMKFPPDPLWKLLRQNL